MIRRPPRSTLFPYTTPSDLLVPRHDLVDAKARNHVNLVRIIDAERRNASHARDRKSTRLNSSHSQISYAVFCLKKKNKNASAPFNLHVTALTRSSLSLYTTP